MIRLFFALLIGKIAAKITQVFHIGLGSSLPGVVAEKIDPKIAKKLSSKLKGGVILITGTNGKTTTAKLISNIISAAGLSKIHNLTGANLTRGVISSLISHSNLLGKIDSDFGLFEIDEATLPEAAAKLNPQIIIFNNLFRDQLDRYGEIDKIVKVWRKTLEKISSCVKIILNVDDPSISFLTKSLKNKTITLGLEDENYKIAKLPSFADAIFCPKCGTKFEYKTLYLSHLGKYFCPRCGLSRPEPQIIATRIELKNTGGINLKISYRIFPKQQKDSSFSLDRLGPPQDNTLEIKINLFGLYNVYNILAAAACGHILGFSGEIIKSGLEKFTPAFGRFEKTKIEKTPITLLLIKNPTGATEVIRSLTQNLSTPTDKSRSAQNINILVILNDNIPDGRDVSWIWDTDWENLVPFTNFIFISGKRAEDMILRLKYAGLDEKKMILIKNDRKALFSACQKSGSNPLYILPNYSAMYSLRNYLAEKGYLPKIV